MLEERGSYVTVSVCVDAIHVWRKVDWRSQTGILIFINKSSIHLCSKKEPSVETSTFGTKFCAMKAIVDMVKALRYKFSMSVVTLYYAANLFCDIEAVWKNNVIPESTLKKKHHYIAYHQCREAVPEKLIRIEKQGTENNSYELLTQKFIIELRRFL